MPKAVVTLPDGQKARIEFTDQAQLDATVNDLVKEHAGSAKEPREATLADARAAEERYNPIERAERRVTEAIGEPALQMVTGAASSAAAGVRGLYDLATGKGANQAADDTTSTAQAGTYQPKTAAGKAGAEVVGAPFRLLEAGSDLAGEKTSEVTGSPAAGAAVKTAINFFAGRAVGKAAGALGKRMGSDPAAPTQGGQPPTPPPGMSAQGAPRTPPSDPGAPSGPTAPQGPPQPPPGMSAQGVPRSPPTDVGGGPAAPETPASPGPGPGAAPGAVPRETPQAARAKEYVRTLGLDWSRLGPGTRKSLETIAQDATALEKLSPAAVKRQVALEQLRVPMRATAGQLERDTVQLRREAIASNTTAGEPIRQVDANANRDLQANLEVLRGRAAGRRGTYEPAVDEEGTELAGRVRSPTPAPSEVGRTAQGALRGKRKWAEKGYQALYKIARETEPDAKVPVQGIKDLYASNPDVQNLGFLKSWMSKAESVQPKGTEGTPAPFEQASLAELHDLRSDANAIARTGGKEGFYAGKVVKAIDEAMKEAPEGAKAWKRANEAFRKYHEEFTDQGLISKLSSQKKGSKADPKVSAQKTFNHIIGASPAEIRALRNSYLKGGTPELRKQGAAAWKSLRGETVNRILEDARNVTSADPAERAILTEAALRRSVKRFPRENLEEILGKGAVKELYRILRGARITTRSPVGGRTTQSGTVPNALVLGEGLTPQDVLPAAEGILSKVVPGAKYVAGARDFVKQIGERGAAVREARDATLTPLEKAARDVTTSRPNYPQERRAAQYRDLEATGPSLPAETPQPTIGDALRRPPP